MKVVALVVGVVFATVATAETPESIRRAREARVTIPIDILLTEPRRRDTPLRYENISDDEVRELQAVARGVVPEALINISGVVSGCPCQDGPLCTHQVWLVAYRPGFSRGLLLSRIDGTWVIGPVQQWWLTYDDLRSRAHTFRPYSAYLEEERRLAEIFPACRTGPDHVGAPPNIAFEPAGLPQLRRTAGALGHSAPAARSDRRRAAAQRGR
jgi:hypothetical protein